MADFAYISSGDGNPKKWMHDSTWYELKAGDRKLVPMEVADSARNYFSNTGSTGIREDPTVNIEPVEGDVNLVPVEAGQFVDEETGIEYGSVAELVAAVKKRIAGSAGDQRKPPAKADEAKA